MVDGKRLTIPLAARDEPGAIAEVLEMKKRPMARAAGRWEETVDLYLAACKGSRKLSDSTRGVRRTVLMAAGTTLGLAGPRSMTEAVARKWVAGLQGREDLKEGSVRDYVAHMRGFAKWCVETGRMSADPTAGIELPPAEGNMRDVFLEAEEVARLLAAARAAGDRDLEWILALGCECGMRRGEMVACRPGWFDLARGCVTVPPEDVKGTEAAGKWRRKGRAGRRRAATVPLSETMLEIIGHHGLPEPFVIAPRKAWGKSRYRFEFRKRFESFMAAQGCAEVTIHDLRRSFGSNRVSAGVSIEKVANWMGIDPKTAWARYARFVPADGEINKGSAGGTRKVAVPVAAEEPAKGGGGDFAARLGKVEELFAAGLITGEERAAKRAAILAEI